MQLISQTRGACHEEGLGTLHGVMLVFSSTMLDQHRLAERLCCKQASRHAAVRPDTRPCAGVQLLQHSDPSTCFRRRVEAADAADDDQAAGQQQQQQQGSRAVLRMNALFLALVLGNRLWASAVLQRGWVLQAIRNKAERLRQEEKEGARRETLPAKGAKAGKKRGQRGQGPAQAAEEEDLSGVVQLPWLQEKLGASNNQTVLLKCAWLQYFTTGMALPGLSDACIVLEEFNQRPRLYTKDARSN